MVSLIDVNVAVALLEGGQKHSAIAVNWLNAQPTESVAICRVVQMGAMRLLTRPSIMKSRALSPTLFWVAWNIFMSDDRMRYTEEPPALEQQWRTICENLPEGHSADTDTYLAAFALSGGSKLITFDKGFQRFTELDKEILSA